MTMMTIEQAKERLSREIELGIISPEEAEAELGAILDNDTASDLRSAGAQW